ncbi:MAG: alpha/beta fold hydrolase, partial [Myxococcales bacterium]
MARVKLLPMGQELLRRVLVRQGAQSVYRELEGHRVHYFDVPGRGAGPTVVLLHGLGGSSIGFSRCLLPLARNARRVIAPDLPGSGWSPEPADGPLGLMEL